MSCFEQVKIDERSLSPLTKVIGRTLALETEHILDSLRERLHNQVLWTINSTAQGGGVAEMLHFLLPYQRGAGVDVRWLVMEGSSHFFRITKRLHHALHGASGDGSPLGEKERICYDNTIRQQAEYLKSLVNPGDILLFHDPQTAGFIPYLSNTGTSVIWRCHIGSDCVNEEVELGWNFLSSYIKEADACVFSREAYIPANLNRDICTIIQPSIDPMSPKNQPMSQEAVHAILGCTGIISGVKVNGSATFNRANGTKDYVQRSAKILSAGQMPTLETPLVVQVSRWDELKDPSGVMEGFCELLKEDASLKAELLLVGPCVEGVSDDPEGAAVYESLAAEWHQLPEDMQKYVHLVSLPMDDNEENAAMVNAIQRHAAVIVQKSLKEGFGLTVTEAMWKEKPIVASAVGGIQDQIEDGVHGLLLNDPTDLKAFADMLHKVLTDTVLGKELGTNAKEQVEKCFLSARHFRQYLELFESLEYPSSRSLSRSRVLNTNNGKQNGRLVLSQGKNPKDSPDTVT